MAIMLAAAMLFTSLPDMHALAEEVTAAEEEYEASLEKESEAADAESAEEAEAAAEEVPAEEASVEEDIAREANGKITPVVLCLTLKYDTDGGEIAEDYETRFPCNHGVITLPANVVKDGYEFIGWYEKKDLIFEEKVTEIPENEIGTRSFTAK